MGLEGFLFALSVLTVGLQIFAWRWALGIQRALAGGLGYELARVITWIMGWTIIARALVTAAVGAYVNFDEPSLSLFLAIGGQLVGAAVFVWAAWRIGRLRESPVDLSGETVAQSDAEAP